MKRLIFLLLLGIFPVIAVADVFQIEDIRIDGLQRVSAGTVFSALPVNAGDLIDDEGVRDASRAIFRTGYFDDVQIGREGDVLVITLKERPAVSEINITGNKAITKEVLLNALRENGLAEGQIFRQPILDGMAQELRRQYVAQGRYGATVVSDHKLLPRNRVAVNLTITEGEVAAIKQINIIGNKEFSDWALLSQFELKTTGVLSWMFNDDKYSKEKLSGDLERLESWYKDRGYLKFAIESTQVSVSPAKDAVYITINVNEDKVYKVGKIELLGELKIPEEDVRTLILLREGMTFSQKLMTASNELITIRLGNEGYTFAKVEGFPEVNEADKTAKVTFVVTPGSRAYVRRIEFRGNTKSADDVLRREMRQMEAGAAAANKIEQSKVRLERLAHFKEVKVDTKEVPGTNDQIDVTYTVEEQPSGSIGASVGFAQGTGIIVGANLQENNFLGTGNSLGIGLNRSSYQTNLMFSLTNPYFTDDGVSAGFKIGASKTDYGEFNLTDYTTDSFTTGVSFGYPLSEISRLNFGFNYENLAINVGTFPTLELNTFIKENGDQYNIVNTSVNWSRSTLNRGVLATKGTLQRAGVEVTIPGSDLEYYKLSYIGQYLRPLTSRYTLRLRTSLGYGDGLGDNSRLPFFKNYFGGGLGSVRGFKRNTLGPQDSPLPALAGLVRSRPYGGNVEAVGGADFIFPAPFLKDKRSVQTAVFFDVGNIFDTECGLQQVNCESPTWSELRYSLGIGGTWLSAFGPITISFGKAFNEGPDDEAEFFQFSLGQVF